MTVSSSVSKETFACNGTTNVFTCPYRVLASTEIRGYLITISTNASVELTNGVDFTVSAVGAANAIVTTTLTYSNLYQLKCVRQTQRLQLTDYRDNDPFPAESHEEALDRVTHIAQEQDDAVSRAILYPEPELGATLPAVAARASKLLGFNSSGVLVVSAPADGTSAALALSLASSANATEGAGMIGFLQAGAASVATTLRAKAREVVSSFDKMTAAQVADVDGRLGLIETTVALQALLDHQNSSAVGSKEITLIDGKYVVTNTGARILQIQNGSALRGSSLEGSTLFVKTGSTATAALEDGGSAAKVELYNVTLSGNSNAALTSGIRLGRRTTQFGTYGTLDNVMVRDMPNAIAYDLNTNIAAVGKLYSISTKDGLISDPAGSGLHIESFTPYEFTGIGYQQAAGDSCNFIEAEAPGADTAVPIVGERALNVGTFLLSIQAGRVVTTPVRINAGNVTDYSLGPTTVFLGSATAKWGDTNTATADATGTATSGGTSSLTDTTKTWGIDQWLGAACHITSGTGAGQWGRVKTSTANSVTLDGAWPTIVPDATSVYTLTYFIRKTAGGGYPHSRSWSAYWPAFYNLSVSNEARADKIVVGDITQHRLTAVATVAPTLAIAANVITPTKPISFVGAGLVKTITVPALFVGGGRITLIPTAAFTTDATANIAIASTAVIGRHMDFVYDATTTKWYPSY